MAWRLSAALLHRAMQSAAAQPGMTPLHNALAPSSLATVIVVPTKPLQTSQDQPGASVHSGGNSCLELIQVHAAVRGAHLYFGVIAPFACSCSLTLAVSSGRLTTCVCQGKFCIYAADDTYSLCLIYYLSAMYRQCDKAAMLASKPCCNAWRMAAACRSGAVYEQMR